MELPAEIMINDVPVTITAIYPDDGPLGSITFDAAGQTACGAVFLTSQNGIPAEAVTEAAITAALAAIL